MNDSLEKMQFYVVSFLSPNVIERFLRISRVCNMRIMEHSVKHSYVNQGTLGIYSGVFIGFLGLF